MILIDSVGWIEFFTEGPLAAKYAKHFESISEVLVPTLVLYEVYRKIKRERGGENGEIAVSLMQRGQTRLLTEELALQAVDLGLRHGLAMADSIVYATAISAQAKLITSDKDLKDLPNVIYYAKP